MLVELDPRDKPLYDKLRISAMDIAHALGCAQFLIKKKWHSYEWERRGSTYLQQSALTTSLVVSYARPFTKTRGLRDNLPSKLIRRTAEERALHEKILKLRNEVYAHSDGALYSFQPWQSEGLSTVIERWPHRRLSKEDTLAFEMMAMRTIEALRERMTCIFPGK